DEAGQAPVPGAGDRRATGNRAVTTLYLIRHGETDWNRLGLFQGTTDVPLNAAGREQARALAEALRDVELDAAYSSPLSRALRTAEAAVEERGIEVRVLAELREICYGLWQGRGSQPRGRCNPGLEWRWREDPWSVRFPGGEALSEVRERAAAAVRRIQTEHPGERVLVSGHGHLNRVLLIEALDWPESRFWEIEQGNACCCRLEFDGGRWTMREGLTR